MPTKCGPANCKQCRCPVRSYGKSALPFQLIAAVFYNSAGTPCVLVSELKARVNSNTHPMNTLLQLISIFNRKSTKSRFPQDCITLPAGLRKEARKYFDLHNITAYSLFGGEDSLMEMLAVRESTFD